ncbi:AQG_2a_G0034720.mRNA.1.CDS.1 [Saccharomyces cerevisiae]|uniref:EKC/KEOPS complex subunit PCC1 n=9 Tax=Saccharomyces TaxID=4930 RepID=PCC1_YEAST|nr:chromatin DNA-binding EKC/KEOPS complex subunit PCC1 [Saccharomyces cerevisiae S288C]XP_033767713.1 Mlp1 [Saccharomyces paradoxus]Q3E833.1 RecName: Full=EKC/KEOPS complex subunit PCC1; AltName: Full=Polarized growth chromatin-associated controller 1 [Saccharomyces cerevisiae S288C]AHY76329.1 Pcc1p [Saccharomyces cerevisiae YJM993]AJP40123.1 Pcc1p [Saccharomyces cerevisiae YJM1078]AJS30321.1 Pcc1p [Saccharomyces cerevisiae YJM189]AJS30622.1 Pcc1p [Saccharomyces cerevisiae YJM193]AJS31220.1|eukprot:NP_878113.4 chromatin DNA-binding EKC/KEOPS complex subunit PCC1 [Saccharomyces cerevisiae S288C]
MTSKREKSLDHTLELKIPFETERQATIATKVLSPDPILKPQDFQVDYSSEKNVMLVQFRSIDDRVLRVGVSSIIDSIKTIVEAMDVLS